MSEQPSLNIEALARLDLRPDEILVVAFGDPDVTAWQCAEVQEWLTDWLADHSQPVAGVLVLPQGTQLAAIRAPQPVTVNVDFKGTGWDSDQVEGFTREFTDRFRRRSPGQH